MKYCKDIIKCFFQIVFTNKSNIIRPATVVMKILISCKVVLNKVTCNISNKLNKMTRDLNVS